MINAFKMKIVKKDKKYPIERIFRVMYMKYLDHCKQIRREMKVVRRNIQNDV